MRFLLTVLAGFITLSFARQLARPRSILVIGDSLVAHGGVARALRSAGYTVDNDGTTGAGSAAIARRLEAILAQGHWDVVIVWAGTNDANPDTTRSNAATMAAMIRAAGSRPIFLGLLGGRLFQPPAGAAFVSLSDLGVQYFRADRVHLTNEGQEIVGGRVVRSLA